MRQLWLPYAIINLKEVIIMQNALMIADYIIKKAIELGCPISNIELQKYLYYLNAKFLVANGEPLFSEPIEKWKFGPVVPAVYHEYKTYGAQDIDKVSDHEELFVEGGKIVFKKNPTNIDEISNDTRASIDDSLQRLFQYNRFDLVDMTHEHSEWKKDEIRILNGEKHIEYSNDGIRDYFSSNEDAQIW